MSEFCEDCHGTGRLGKTLDLCGQRECQKCEGTGMMLDERENVARLELEALQPEQTA